MLKVKILAVVCCCLFAAPLFAQEQAQEVDAEKLMRDAASHLQAEDYDKAAEAFQAVVEVAPNNGEAWKLLGYSLHAAGKLDEAIPAHEKAAEFEESKSIALYNLGCAYALKGDKDKAFEYLHKAVDANFDDLSYYESDVDLKDLRDDKRFKKVIARIEHGDDSDVKDKQKHKTNLAGTWSMKSGKRAGAEAQNMPPAITVTKKTFVVPSEDPDEPFVMAYELDRSTSPQQIDFEITSGPAEGTAKGIIKVEDGEMTLCYDSTGQGRPTSFESTEDNGYFMFVMQHEPSIDAKKLVGLWDIDSGSRAGEDVAKERLATEEGVTISEDTITLPAAPDMVFVMGYKINSKTTPAEIDMEIKSGPAPEGSKAVGIIQMNEGEVMFCYDSTGQKRPEEFKTTEEDGFFMFRLKEKKEE